MDENLRPLVMWGASSHAKVLADFCGGLGYRAIALFDRKRDVESPLRGVPVYAGLEGFLEWNSRRPPGPVWGVTAIGGMRGLDRLAVLDLYAANGIQIPDLIHPTAFVAGSVKWAEGLQLMARSSVCVGVYLGRSCMINTAANVDHECVFGDGVHVSAMAAVAGFVSIGKNTFVGMAASILPRLQIGRNVLIGAGSVVTRDVPDGAVVYGSPARILRVDEFSDGPISLEAI